MSAPATVGDLFDLHANADGFAEPPGGERWAVSLDLRRRNVLAIYGPAFVRRADAGPFTVALDPVCGLPCTAPVDAGKLVTVRETADS